MKKPPGPEDHPAGDRRRDKALTKKVIEALHKAVEEQSVSETFRGYGPEKGYDFLRNAISAYYKKNGADVDPDTIFISDGAKSDTATSRICLAKTM